MAAITWESKLEVGIKTIDKQHRKWVELYNALDRALETGEEEKKLAETLDALIDYSGYHFGTEEALMRQHDPQVTPALLEIRLRRWFGMIEQCDQLCAWAKQHWEPESVAS